MEQVDKERILSTLPYDIKLRRLYENHIKLEQRLASLSTRSFLTSSEEMETKRLKKEKLHGMDRMMWIIHRPNGRTAGKSV